MGRWLYRWFAALVVALALLGSPGLARASQGELEAWADDLATGRISLGPVVLRYEPHLEEDARWLAQAIPGWWYEVEHGMAGGVADELHIVFLDHAGRVADVSGMPRWVAGVAHPPTGAITIARHGPDGAPTDLETLLKHEMAHVVLHRAIHGAEVPRWFHEGIAEAFQGDVSLLRAQTLASAVFGGGVPDLDGLETQFEGDDGPRVSAAYAAARDLVTFLRLYDGNGSNLRQVLTELKLGRSFESAFVRAYGHSLEDLAATWREGLPARFIWYPMLAGGGLPVALVLPLVVLAWVRRRKVLRAGWARLQAEDDLLRSALMA
jgi:hypothetical protein